MGALCELPNIGKRLEQRLAAVGITDADTLKSLGSREAFLRLHLREGDTCLCALCGLEGAVQGVRWHQLTPATKAELRKFFESFTKV
ncbi:TfoX/Sxy family protein [Paenibacillus sp. NFR01]|uniref:TfoX/Sxy family protein n=1 Tax=Paenibacillus sp. NFR01 TaxID=1566279 RepID=UPI0008C9AD7C|nr:TfoX/Sxy family protein [Paenibacillus sp. NFR01]SEU28318.1 DNA transformation protein [Paenibacillus sp. NFR01]